MVGAEPTRRYENPTPSKGFKATLRLLFDENVSPSVAAALEALGLKTFAVGVPPAPDKGSTDPELIAWAIKRSCVIVTYNHDMMLMAHAQGAQFVWLDHRNRSMSRFEQARLVLSQIEAWQLLLTDHSGCCVHAGRTFCEALEAADAARRVEQRARERKRRQSTKKSKANAAAETPLPFDL